MRTEGLNRRSYRHVTPLRIGPQKHFDTITRNTLTRELSQFVTMFLQRLQSMIDLNNIAICECLTLVGTL